MNNQGNTIISCIGVLFITIALVLFALRQNTNSNTLLIVITILGGCLIFLPVVLRKRY